MQDYRLNTNYILLCYLKLMLPYWTADFMDIERILGILGNELSLKIQIDVTSIKQQCIENSAHILPNLLIDKAIPLRKEYENFLKEKQSQIQK